MGEHDPVTTSPSTRVGRVPAVLVRRVPGVVVPRVPAVLLCAFSFVVAFGPLSGQEASEAIEPDSTALFKPVTPSTAFLRAVLVPGWGHASIGSHTRAGFYFTLEATTTYGLLRTRTRLNEVRARVEEQALEDTANLPDLRVVGRDDQ